MFATSTNVVRVVGAAVTYVALKPARKWHQETRLDTARKLEAPPGRTGMQRPLVISPSSAMGCNYSVAEKTIAELTEDMASGRVTAQDLVLAYLKAIEDIDVSGPSLHSVLAVNPQALFDAQRLDEERARGDVRGPLHGIPIIIKDNVETADPIPTTAGSLALSANCTRRDAPLVARLRAAGAVILGKANLSEWANIRSNRSTSGWSAVGGLTRNPYALDRTSVGSSSGSAVAVAANLAAAGIGTETDGSVTCPAAVAGIVGLKPTVGLLSRRHIIPISHSQDTAGPMTRTVEDAATLLTVMAGSDSLDPATSEADDRRLDYLAALNLDSLQGARIGVARFLCNDWEGLLRQEFELALERMRNEGAEIVEIDNFPAEDARCQSSVSVATAQGRLSDIAKDELTVLLCELKAGLASYLAEAAPDVGARTLADIIAFNHAEASKEMVYFGQDLFHQAEATDGLRTEGYQEALERSRRLAGPEGIDAILREHRLVALVVPTMSPPWIIDLVNGDHYQGSASMLPAVAGYPHITVPMGQVFGLPVGLSFIGPAWSEAQLLSLAGSFEKCSAARRQPTFAAHVP